MVGGLTYPSKKYEFVSWDDYCQYMKKMNFLLQTTNQYIKYIYICWIPKIIPMPLKHCPPSATRSLSWSLPPSTRREVAKPWQRLQLWCPIQSAEPRPLLAGDTDFIWASHCIPICSMYGLYLGRSIWTYLDIKLMINMSSMYIFTYIWAICGVNGGKYSIHGAYGICNSV